MTEAEIVGIFTASLVLAFAAGALPTLLSGKGIVWSGLIALLLVLAFGGVNVWYGARSFACPHCPAGGDDTRQTAWRGVFENFGIWLIIILTCLGIGTAVGALFRPRAS
jgi:hypothetical protein